MYVQIFRDRALLSLAEIDSIFPENPDDLGKVLFAKQKKFLQSILSITDRDLDELIERFQNGNNSSSLGKLSQIYRHITLGRALDLQTEEFLIAIDILGNPFEKSEATVQFVEQVIRIKKTGLNFYELQYILTGKQHSLLDKNIIQEAEVERAVGEIWRSC